jgi:hypothetical protein
VAEGARTIFRKSSTPDGASFVNFSRYPRWSLQFANLLH